MENILNRYDLDKIIEVLDDRLADYTGIQKNYEESYAGESELNGDKYYEFGYGQRLEDALNILKELKKFK